MKRHALHELQQCAKRHLVAKLVHRMMQNKYRSHCLAAGTQAETSPVLPGCPTPSPLDMLYRFNILPDLSLLHPTRKDAGVTSGMLTWINLIAYDIETIEDLNRMRDKDQAHPELLRENRLLRPARLQIKQQPAVISNNRALRKIRIADPRFDLYWYTSPPAHYARNGYSLFTDYEAHYQGEYLQVADLLALFVRINDFHRERLGCLIYSGIATHRIAEASAELSHISGNMVTDTPPNTVEDDDRIWLRLKLGTAFAEAIAGNHSEPLYDGGSPGNCDGPPGSPGTDNAELLD